MKNIVHLFLCTILVLSSNAHDLKIKADRTVCMAGVTTDSIVKDILTEYGYDCVEIPNSKPHGVFGFISIPLYFYLCSTSIIGVSILESIDAMRDYFQKVKENFNNTKALKEVMC